MLHISVSLMSYTRLHNPADPFYGAGEGGRGAQQVQQVIGAGGGAGGSAYGRGGDGLPLNGVNSTGAPRRWRELP